MSYIEEFEFKGYRKMRLHNFNIFGDDDLYLVIEELGEWQQKQTKHNFKLISEEQIKECRDHALTCVKSLLSCYPGKRPKEMNSYITALVDDLLDFTPDLVTEVIKSIRKTIKCLPPTAEVYQAVQRLHDLRLEDKETMWDILEERAQIRDKQEQKEIQEENYRIAQLKREQDLRQRQSTFENNYRDGFIEQEGIGISIFGEEVVKPGSLWVAAEYIASNYEFDEDRMTPEIVDILRRLHGFGNPHEDRQDILETYKRTMQLITENEKLTPFTIKTLSRDAIDEFLWPPLKTTKEKQYPQKDNF